MWKEYRIHYRSNPEQEGALPVYKIPEDNMPRLQAEIANLNERALKLGSEPIELNILREEIVTHKDKDFSWQEKYYFVTVTGEPPKLAGWQLIAVITPQPSGENLVKCIPGKECPIKYRTADPYHCDHCGTRRRRNDVFIVKHVNGEYAQIGRQCLKDFLGHKDPNQIIAGAELIWDADELAQKAEDSEWGAGFQPTELDLLEYVSACVCCIRRLGWVPRSRANEMQRPTSDCALDLIMPPRDRQSWNEWVHHNQLFISEHDTDLAEKAIEWGQQLPVDEGDYVYNLGVAVRNNLVTLKTAGLIASLVPAYQREMQREQELLVQQKTSHHLGSVGERMDFPNVIVRNMRSIPSDYGVRTMIRFEDPDGNILVWWKSGEPDDWTIQSFENATPVDINGKIKTHDSYHEIAQTIISHVKHGLYITKKKSTTKSSKEEGAGGRVCSVCKQPGHNKRTCPNKQRRLRRKHRS